MGWSQTARAFGVLLAAFCLLGCSQKGPLFQRISQTPEGNAFVYVYQVGGDKAPAAHVRVHRQGSYAIEMNEYTYWELHPGTHRVQMQWGIGYRTLRRNPDLGRVTRRKFEAKPGRSYFYRLEVTQSGYFKDVEWQFKPVRDEELALRELAGCHRSDQKVRTRSFQ